MDRPVLRPSQLFGLFCLSAFFVYLVLLFLIVLVSLLPSRHLFLIFALLSPLALCTYLRRRSSHRGRSQGTSSKGNLQGDQHDDKIPAYFIGYRHGFNTPESWAWGLPKQMGTPFTSSKDNLQGDQNDEEIPILMSRNDSYLEDFGRSVYFIGALLGFNTPKSWESWGPPEQMGAPFTSTKDNVEGDQNQIDFSEQNETNRITQPCSGLSEPSSSPDSCECSKMNRSPKSTKCALSSICGMHDENLVPGKKKHDLSSCDSNRTPSSEVEKGAGLNKKEVKGVNEQGEHGSSIVQEFRDTPGNIKSCSEGLKQEDMSSNMPATSCRVLCHCGLQTSLLTSRQPNNFRRKFYNCPRKIPEQCSFFRWADSLPDSQESDAREWTALPEDSVTRELQQLKTKVNIIIVLIVVVIVLQFFFTILLLARA